VGDTVNPKTRRLVVRCTIPNPDQRLKPGMFATVIADTGAPRQVAAVSIASVQEIDGRKIVFLEQPNAAFLVREVMLGTEKDGWVEVTRGIAAGDRVVGKGSFLLKSELLKASMKDEG
jgi:multidrug efflux pump subunit AcrA (membrane-fusion protein)